ELAAQVDTEAVEDGRIDDSAIDAVLFRQQRRGFLARLQLRARDLAEQRIAVVDGVEIEKDRVAAVVHGAAVGGRTDRLAHLAERLHVAQLVLIGTAVATGDAQVAAEQHVGVLHHGALQGVAHRAHAGDGADAKRQAGQQNAEAAEVAAQVEDGDPRPVTETAHAGTASRTASESWPWFMVSTRSALEARLRSCVISRIAAPFLRARLNIRSITRAPVSWSRLPVGSSARSRCGSVTMARARPTRCC